MHDLPFEHAHQLTDREFEGCCKNCEHSEEIIKEHILGFYEKIRHFTPHKLRELPVQRLYNLYQVLDDIANLKAGDRLASLVLADKDIEGVLPTIRYYYAIFFDVHEESFVRELISSPAPKEFINTFPLLDKYRELIRNQMKELSPSQGQTMVFLGCGAFPISPILVASLYNTRVIGIDKNPQKVELARRCIEALGLKDIEIIEGDERVISSLDPDIISIAALAQPKKRIFKNIYNLLTRRRCVVCCRTYSGLKALLYYPLQKQDIEGFVIKREIRPLGRANNTVVFLERCDNA